MSNLNPQAKEFLNRIKDGVARTSAMGRLSDWLTQNTTLHGRPFSFTDHEFQRQIMDERHPNVAIIKPSQVGMSETVARLVVGFLAVQNNSTAIYTLPTVNEALKFVKARIDPVIDGSPYLRSCMGTGNDSSSFKKIGGSQFNAAGTWGRDLISIAADIVACDEIDNSNPAVLRSVESRLLHSRFIHEELNIRGFRRWLSTPSVNGVGISAIYARSDRRSRLVKCKHCADWFYPDFHQHVVVDGYDKPFATITPEDIIDLDERGLLTSARMLCPSCHGLITQANLADEYREWVAEFPHITAVRGYRISPFDLPSFHSPQSLLRQRIEYGNEESQFYNYSLGLPYDSSTNSFSAEAIRNNTTLSPVLPGSSISGTVMGMDFGKTSWLVIMKPVRAGGTTEYHVIWAEQLRVEDDNLYMTACERIKQFGVVRAVIDSAPYFDTAIRIQKAFHEGLVMPCSYTLTDRKLPSHIVNETTWTLAANRTKSFDYMAKTVNSGRFKFANFPEMGTMAQHFQNIKRVERREDGEVIGASWVKAGGSGDHYAHACLYSFMAAQMIEAGEYTNFAMMPSIKECFVGKNYKEEGNGSRY